MSNVYLSAADFFKTVRPGEKVFFLLRHGERGHILPDDPDHGAFVGLTERGRKQAYQLGCTIGCHADLRHAELVSASAISRPCLRCASDVAASVSFFSSPVGRCMETARNIGRGMGIEEPVVEPLQPLAEFFVEHYDAYMETHKTGFYQGICRWLDGTANVPGYIDPAYFPLARRSQEMLDLMLEKGKSRMNIFCSHDAWIVPCLAHFCGFKFTPQLWMNFLSGIAFVIRDESSGVVTNSVSIDRIVAVTGMDDGNMYF